MLPSGLNAIRYSTKRVTFSFFVKISDTLFALHLNGALAFNPAKEGKFLRCIRITSYA
jgi:hypothetical protein